MEGSEIHRIKSQTTSVSENGPVCWVLESQQKNLRDVKVSLVIRVEVKAHIAVMDCHNSDCLHTERKTSLCFFIFSVVPGD